MEEILRVKLEELLETQVVMEIQVVQVEMEIQV